MLAGSISPITGGGSTKGQGPIFVVGPSRSGTALVRACLNQHPDVHVAGETHYFEDVRPRLRGHGEALTPEDARRCEDHFLSLAHRPYGHSGDPDASPMDREALRACAQDIGTHAEAYFEAYCRLEAERYGKRRWGEKTPRHVFQIDEIVSSFPDARVICMIRDPRAVVASYRDWQNQGGFDLERDPTHADALEQEEDRVRRSYDVLVVSLLWRSALRAASRARQDHGPGVVRLFPYEELVADPDGGMHQLATWLDLDFTEAMLDVPVLNSSVSTFSAHGGFSSEPLRRWRQRLSEGEVAAVQSACRRPMLAHGYALEPVAVSPFSVGLAWARLPKAVTRAALANRTRIVNLPAYLWRRLRPGR